MPFEEDFIKAVETLKARNQAYVNRNGENQYSRNTDRLIFAMANYYNQTIGELASLKETIARMKNIIALYNISNDLEKYPKELLSLELRRKRESGEFIEMPFMYLSKIITAIHSHQTIIESTIQTLYTYEQFKRVGNKQFSQSLKDTWPELEIYFHQIDQGIKLTEIIKDFKQSYYAGNFATEQNEASVEK